MMKLRKDVDSICLFSGELMNENLEVIGEINEYGEIEYY